MLSLALIGDESASSSGSSDSMTESQYSSQIPSKTKPEYKNFKSWKFLDTIQADVLAGEFEDIKLKLIEHEQPPIGQFVSGPSQSLRI